MGDVQYAARLLSGGDCRQQREDQECG